jgi:proteasome lid subunit RPN8/RPN11
MSYSDKTVTVPIRLSDSVWEKVQQHAEETYPLECCGFLFGKDGDVREMNAVLQASNSKDGDQRRRFEISGSDYMKAERYAVENDLDFLGIYHSHPDHPAIPSSTDLQSALPFFSYVIVSIMKGKRAETSSWQLGEEGLFDRENIQRNINESIKS